MDEMTPNDLDMSLSYLFRNGFKPHPYFYNCTGVDGFENGMSRPILGSYFLIVGIILVSIYIPCLFVISRSDLMNSSCYKIMFYLGFLDISCICTNSLTTGFLGIKGATFCSYPTFIYIMGGVGCGCWMGTCCTCIVLAINRCCDVNHSLKIRTIFIGNNIYITMMVPVIYTIYSVFFTKPLIFDSNYLSWFFYPSLPTTKPTDYINIAHTINNCIVSATTTFLYTYLCLLLIHKNSHAQSDSLSKTQRQVFIQSVIICSFNAIAAYIYVYMQFFYSPPEVILMGQIAWQCGHGSVCIVYITMNKTVRRGVIDLVVPKKIRNKLSIGTTTATRPILAIVSSNGVKQTMPTGTSSGTVF